MADPSQAAAPMSPDEALPPVEPPSAGFIVQLFVIPGVIVLIIVLVWLMFNWLAQMGNDPHSYIAALRRDNETRWHAAVNLANALSDPKNLELKQNAELAAELAGILDLELDSRTSLSETSDSDARAVNLRIYLCKALGEFHVLDGVPVLLKAADTQLSPAETPVRVAAIESLAVLTDRLGTASEFQPYRPDIEKTVLTASEDEAPVVRYRGAFALGLLGGDKPTQRLIVMLDDLDTDTRYNAATGLARHGRIEAERVLLEMLEPTQAEAIEIERGKQEERRDTAREYKRSLIHANALRAVLQLAKANPSADLSRLASGVEALIASGLPQQLDIQARSTLEQLNHRSESPESKAA